MAYDLPDYFRATNLAYEVLLNNSKIELPILILPLIKATPNVRFITYSEYALIGGQSFNAFVDGCPSNSGFTLRCGNNYIIVVNERLPYEVFRFTLAHELGHCMLEHSCDNSVSRKEASCFARNLLCPYPIRSGLMLNAPSEYVKTFAVSKEMATITINLHDNDRYYTIRNLANQVSGNFSDILNCRE